MNEWKCDEWIANFYANLYYIFFDINKYVNSICNVIIFRLKFLYNIENWKNFKYFSSVDAGKIFNVIFKQYTFDFYNLSLMIPL